MEVEEREGVGVVVVVREVRTVLRVRQVKVNGVVERRRAA